MGILPTKNAFLSVSFRTKKRFAVGILSDKKAASDKTQMAVPKLNVCAPQRTDWV